MDTESGVVVVVDADAGTWTFDVCTNTWAKQATKGSPPTVWPRLVYDAASDLTYAFGIGEARTYSEVRTYDVESATWTQVNSQDVAAEGLPILFFLDPARRTVYAYNNQTGGMTSYDLASNRWAPVGQGTVRPPIPENALGAFDASAGRIILMVSGDQTWTFEPATGRWAKVDAFTPQLNFGYFPLGSEVAYDSTTRKTVVFADSRLVTFDATTGVWTKAPQGKGWPPPHRDPPGVSPHPDGRYEILTMTDGPLARHGHALVNDPVNGRVLMLGGEYRGEDWTQGTHMWAYDVDANTWTMVVPPQPD